MFVTSFANPICRDAAPKIEQLAKDYDGKVRFYVMEMTTETTPMLKFGVQNTPVFVIMDGKGKSETLLGADMEGLERKLDALV